MKAIYLTAISGAMLVAMSLSSCETPGRGAAVGALTGAGIGALATGEPGGALVGAAVGAGTGAAIGAANREDRRRYYRHREYEEY